MFSRLIPISATFLSSLRRCVLLLPLLWLGATGCQTPNVKPFGDATADVHAAVRQAYTVTASRLDAYEAVDSDGNRVARSSTNHPAARFNNTWATRLRVMEAMVSYSDSLVNIVASGEQSKANAKAMSDQVAALVEATPWSAFGAAGNSIFQQVHGLAVSVAQYRSIAKAVNKADEAVQKAAEAIGKDMDSLAILFKALFDDQELSVVGMKYGKHRAYVNALTAKRGELENEMLRLRNSTDAPRIALLEARLSGKSQSDLDPLQKKLQDAQTNQKLVGGALAECDALLERVADTEKAYQMDLKALRSARQAALDLATATRESIRLWGLAHRDLKAAIEENRQPNVRLLVASALEIRATIQQLKNP